MQNQIRENGMLATDHKNKLETLLPFIKLTETHDEKNILKSMMLEIVPRMQEEAQNIAQGLIKQELVEFVTRSEHKNESET